MKSWVRVSDIGIGMNIDTTPRLVSHMRRCHRHHCQRPPRHEGPKVGLLGALEASSAFAIRCLFVAGSGSEPMTWGVLMMKVGQPPQREGGFLLGWGGWKGPAVSVARESAPWDALGYADQSSSTVAAVWRHLHRPLHRPLRPLLQLPHRILVLSVSASWWDGDEVVEQYLACALVPVPTPPQTRLTQDSTLILYLHPCLRLRFAL